nr:glycosyltransferase family 4 protein [Allobacillus salarius]
MKYWKDAIKSKGKYLNFKIIENTAGKIFESYDEALEKPHSDNIIIGFAGRYTDWKNWPLAVEITKELNKVLGDKLYVNMAVGCLDERSTYDTKLMFKELKDILGNRFKGYINIDIEAMNNFYYDIDIFILTSKFNTESFGRTLVEAMSRKTVVLTTDAGGSVEVVDNNESVCETAYEFIERILHFYNNKQLMQSEKERNLFKVKQKYSLKNNIDKHLNLYRSIINEKEA